MVKRIKQRSLNVRMPMPIFELLKRQAADWEISLSAANTRMLIEYFGANEKTARTLAK